MGNVGLLFAGVIAPLVCFVTTELSDSPPGFDLWQSGQFDVYANLLLYGTPFRVFYPLLLYSLTCMTLTVIARDRYLGVFIVRVGLLLGVVLAIHFAVLVSSAFNVSSNALGAIVGLATLAVIAFPAIGIFWLTAWTTWHAAKWFGHRRFWPTLIMLITLFWGAMSILYQDESTGSYEVLFAPAVWIWFGCLIFGAPWAVAAYSLMSIAAFRQHGSLFRRLTLKRLMGIVSVIALYFGNLRVSLNLMLVEYAKLPTEDPNCYVCTAAARGHGRLVRSRSVATSTATFAANDQMRVLKAAELLIRHLTPRGHRLLRRIYNRLGPPLARRLSRPLAADLAYLSLKPAEWLARGLLCLLLANRAAVVGHLYRG